MAHRKKCSSSVVSVGHSPSAWALKREHKAGRRLLESEGCRRACTQQAVAAVHSFRPVGRCKLFKPVSKGMAPIKGSLLLGLDQSATATEKLQATHSSKFQQSRLTSR